MKTTTKHQSFLATSSKKYFKFGLLGAFAITIAAFKMPLYSNPSTFKIEGPGIENDPWTVTQIYSTAAPTSIPKLEIKQNPTPPKLILVEQLPDFEDPETAIKATDPDEGTLDPEKKIEEIEIPKAKKPVVRDYAEVMPEFIGGEKAMYEFVYNNIIYSPDAVTNDIEGKVYVKFVINTLGEVVDAKVIKGIDKLLDREALKVVQNMPKWSPGFQNGELVNVSIVLPINFVLN